MGYSWTTNKFAFAYTLKRRLVEKFGRSITYDGEEFWMFPTPSAIAKLTVEDLVSAKNDRQKMRILNRCSHSNRYGPTNKGNAF